MLLTCLVWVQQLLTKYKIWPDLKSISKNAVVKYKSEIGRSSRGVNKAKEPMEFQLRFASFIGRIYNDGIPYFPGIEDNNATEQGI